MRYRACGLLATPVNLPFLIIGFHASPVHILLPYMEGSSVFCLHTVIALLIVVQHEKDTWTNHCTKFPGKTPGRFPALRVCYVAKPHRAEEEGGAAAHVRWRLAPELGAHSAWVTWHAEGVNLQCQFPLLELLTAIWS